jgi:hypothetical protein
MGTLYLSNPSGVTVTPTTDNTCFESCALVTVELVCLFEG